MWKCFYLVGWTYTNIHASNMSNIPESWLLVGNQLSFTTILRLGSYFVSLCFVFSLEFMLPQRKRVPFAAWNDCQSFSSSLPTTEGTTGPIQNKQYSHYLHEASPKSKTSNEPIESHKDINHVRCFRIKITKIHWFTPHLICKLDFHW